MIGDKTGFNVYFFPFLRVIAFFTPEILVVAIFLVFTFTVMSEVAPLFIITVITALPAFFAVILRFLLSTAATLALLDVKAAILSDKALLAISFLAETDFLTCTGNVFAVSFTSAVSFGISLDS